MIDAPERIKVTIDDGYVFLEGEHAFQPDYWPNVEYVRADLAGLPGSLARRLKEKELDDGYILTALERDILAWHEQQKGGVE